jgi:hypothetical protein
MKYFILPILIVFAVFNAQAQLSADNYDLKTQNNFAFENSTGTSQFNADLHGDDFNKKRRRKKKSSPLGFGLITGGSMFSISGDETDGVKMKFGMQIGLFGVYQLNEMFGVKSGVIFTQKGFKINEEIFGMKFDYVTNFNYVNIPILGTIGFGDSFKIYANAGPVLGVFLSGKTTSDDESMDVEGIKTTDLGVLVGGGVIIPVVQSRKSPTISILADVNYQLGLANIEDADDYTTKNNGITFGIGILIGGI